MGVSSVPLATLHCMTPHSAQAIAAEIRKRLPGVPTKKLHKLLYYAQAHHAATFREPLFSETISAWDMGPVVAPLWWQENQHGPDAPPPHDALSEAELNTIGYVISRYGKLSGLELERLTHSEAPWIDANDERQRLGEKSRRITIAALIEYFTQQAEAGEESDPPIDSSAFSMWIKEAHIRPASTVADTPKGILAHLR